jgi:hypothetical protein
MSDRQQLSTPVGPQSTCPVAPPAQLGVTTHAPNEQISPAEQATSALFHCPLPSHVCGTRPLHCFAPGVHEPVHALAVQMYAHAAPSLCHTPLTSHVCG